MASLYILIPIAIIFVIIAVAIFLWAVKSDQYDDLERQGSNILFEEDDETTSNNKNECHSDNKNKDC
ncbi:TPA: cbb3-type cytochrome oxidase assembly protein CcoS [Photobacterium damselae]|uniref:cbb3-type cytochrome oxidase assembly protein CcoS n=1 Tax=Photobacterium damselae TaxID=38293 RepID=UPI000D065F12|nr:cbb3-type cytochrome oxidase assembly protein CcoS [Photobacterium damselae]MCG3814202.1 cbb3-type cytochrome oxidase assembly protein CcoS [Photobacterium damselae]MCG9704772.1 cbb3-type cytochrome oxidase assembly protein CcoS [Photobacterium damselae]PSB81976.1 cbb3-type cytochrome oxidase assembly protein CcoS [Photobacterium damselae subsp. damselae]UKA07605.1 cbb3-type cytochrome oxidase assembly protein CcoS [Photobacterium damselae subsp. damselae]UKA22710.1 cbb3-type cytochrome oxi